MKLTWRAYGVLVMVLLTACHMDKYYADRRLPHDPPPTEESKLAVLQDDAEKQTDLLSLTMDEAAPATVHTTSSKKRKPKAAVASTMGVQNYVEEEKTIVPTKNTDPVTGKKNAVVEAPGKNQNIPIFFGLLATALLVGLWSLAYVFFTSRTLWIPLAGIAIALFITSLIFLIAQPIN